MKAKELKGTKAASKNTPVKQKPGRGGKRPGSGRKPLEFPVKNILLDAPGIFIDVMQEKGISNKTGYVNNLIASDLLQKGLKKRQEKQILKIKNDTDKFNPE